MQSSLSLFGSLSVFCDVVTECECVENTCLAPTAAEWVRERASASELAGATHVGAFACLCVCVWKHQCRQRRSWFFLRTFVTHIQCQKQKNMFVCVWWNCCNVCGPISNSVMLVNMYMRECVYVNVCFANFSEKFAIQKAQCYEKC